MIGEVIIAGLSCRVDFSRPYPIAIPLDPHGPQPAFFTERPASARPLQAGEYVGSVKLGGSCNAEEINLVPHCHGTHTEGIGHVSPHPVPVQECIYPGPSLAMLVSLESIGGDQPLLLHDDLAASVAACWRDGTEAIVIRTLPNPRTKMHADYATTPYPVLDAGAIHLLAGLPLKHLLIDTPSLDPAQDGGRLANHRCWWGMGGVGHEAVDGKRRSVTELVYVPDELQDGHYWLQLELAPVYSDATPSRPLLHPLEFPR